MAEHISRKELKQDKIRSTFEHGAEAVLSHQQAVLVILLVILVVAGGYGGWTFYHQQQETVASAAFNQAMSSFNGHVGPAVDPNEPPSDFNYPDEAARSNDAEKKFAAVAAKYPHTDSGRWTNYYEALCLEDLERHNQAMELLQKISSGSDHELANLAQYQIGVIDERTGKPDDAIKIFRALADKASVFVPQPIVQLELARVLTTTNPAEAMKVYQQVKTENPNTSLADEADRNLQLLGAKS